MKITIITKECKAKDKNAIAKPIFVFDSEIRILTSKSVPTLRLCLTIGTMMHFPIEGQKSTI